MHLPNLLDQISHAGLGFHTAIPAQELVGCMQAWQSSVSMATEASCGKLVWKTSDRRLTEVLAESGRLIGVRWTCCTAEKHRLAASSKVLICRVCCMPGEAPSIALWSLVHDFARSSLHHMPLNWKELGSLKLGVSQTGQFLRYSSHRTEDPAQHELYLS